MFLLNGCMPKERQLEEKISPQEAAEKTAEKFARYWEQSDYESMYDLFVPELQNQRSKEDFNKFFLASEKSENVVIRLDKVSLDNENEAYVYYTVSSSIYDVKAPAIKMETISGEWRVNAFANFFTDECTEVCLSRNCKTVKCSSETGFKCDYIDVEPCSCNDSYDCSYDRPICDYQSSFCRAKECNTDSDCITKITQEQKDECESRDIRNEVYSYCTISRAECYTKCREKDIHFSSHTVEEKAKLSLNVMPFEDYIEIKNFDKDLTHVSVVINWQFRKDIGSIPSGTKLNIQKKDILNIVTGNDLPRSLEIGRIYIYSREGKWWWYSGNIND